MRVYKKSSTNILRIVCSIMLSAIMVIYLGNITFAQTPALDSVSGTNRTGLEISPAIFEQVVTPGASHPKQIVIRNITSDYLLIRTRAKPLVPYEEIINKDARSRFDASTWVQVQEPDFILGPGQPREVKFTINSPEKAEPGGHYVQIVFELLLPQQQDKTQASTVNLPNISSIGFLTVPGDIHELLDYGADIQPRFFSFGRDMKLPIPIENTGNIHSIASTTVTIRNWRGKTVKEIVVPPRMVLPNTVRNFEAVWQRGLRVGLYSIEISTTYGTPTKRLSTGRVYVFAFLNLFWLFIIGLVAGLLVLGVLKRERVGYMYRTLRGRIYHADKSPVSSSVKYDPKIRKKRKKNPKLRRNY